MLAIRGPGASAEISCERRVYKWLYDGVLEDEVIDGVVGRIILGRRGESKDANGAIIAGGSKVFVGRIEGDALDVTGMIGKGLEFLEGETRPNNDFGIQPDRD